MKSLTIGLVGNPNAGKTTLFNALTGSKQCVGNWPGVTVERKSGEFYHHDYQVTVIDIPGIYSLTSLGQSALDEQIACDFILSHPVDMLINVIDAAHLERNLYLTAQLLAINVPLIVALTMTDVAQQQGSLIDTTSLSKQLGYPVIPVIVQRKRGLRELKEAILHSPPQSTPPQQPHYPPHIDAVIHELMTAIQEKQPQYSHQARYFAISLLEGDRYTQQRLQNHVDALRPTIEDADLFIADARYDFAHQIAITCTQKTTPATRQFTMWLDRIVLNRFLGIPLFLGVMYSMFLFAINIGGIFQDFFDITTNTFFVAGPSYLLKSWGMPDWIIALIAHGAGKGINTVATFIPIISGMFLFLSFLEHSGYMARAAFVMDRFMRAVGLPGKSFVPLIVGFGCNVPAIMAARTLESPRDRILTILMSPYMACGARLTIFAVFGAAFFPHHGQNITFALYLIGILIAFSTGLLLRKTLLHGESTPFIMELPPYHLPTLRLIVLQTWARLKNFLWQAGKIIVPIGMALGVLNTLTTDLTLINQDVDQTSLLSALGRLLTPLFAPLGLEANNWPATVALLTGTLAKEVVIATLNTLYTQTGHLTAIANHPVDVWQNLSAAFASIAENFRNLPQALQNPIVATAKNQELSHGVYAIMNQYFISKASVFAYLLFTLLYIPCLSTTAVIARELNKRWALFSILWSTMLAYGLAVCFYQLATLTQHPISSTIWCFAIVSIFMMTILHFRSLGENHACS